MAGHPPALGQSAQRMQHRLGAAADEMLRSRPLFEELGDEAPEANAAVVAGQVNLSPGRTKVMEVKPSACVSRSSSPFMRE